MCDMRAMRACGFQPHATLTLPPSKMAPTTMQGSFGRPIPLLENLLAPEVMQSILGTRTKLMVLLRDPVERLYSSFVHFGTLKTRHALQKNKTACRGFAAACVYPTPAEFHLHVVNAIAAWTECVHRSAELECAYSTVRATKQRPYLAVGMYAIFLEVWWRYFPKELLLVLRSEDYYARQREVLTKTFDFVGVAYVTHVTFIQPCSPQPWQPCRARHCVAMHPAHGSTLGSNDFRMLSDSYILVSWIYYMFPFLLHLKPHPPPRHCSGNPGKNFGNEC